MQQHGILAPGGVPTEEGRRPHQGVKVGYYLVDGIQKMWSDIFYLGFFLLYLAGDRYFALGTKGGPFKGCNKYKQ